MWKHDLNEMGNEMKKLEDDNGKLMEGTEGDAVGYTAIKDWE